MNERIKEIVELDKTSKNVLKGIKLYLLLFTLIISKNEIKNYIDRENLKPNLNITIQDEKEILKEKGFDLEHENYLSIKKYECEKVVDKYANIYGIKKDVVMNIIRENSESFSSPEFQLNRDIFATGEVYDDFNLQVLLLVHDLYSKPYMFGYKSEDIRCESNTEIISDVTIREYVCETSEILGLDKDTALAIACAESHYFEAGIATNKCNPFALNSSNGFRCFENLYLGTTEGLIFLKNNCPSLNIESMASGYCPPDPEHWKSLVYGCKSELERGRKFFDEKNMEMTLK